MITQSSLPANSVPLSKNLLSFFDPANNDFRQRISSPTSHIGYDAQTSFSSPQCDFALSSYKVRTGTEITFSPIIVGTSPSAVFSYNWEITLPNNTTTTLTTATPAFTPSLHGIYSVSLIVTDTTTSTNLSAPAPLSFSACDEIVNVSSGSELEDALTIAIDSTTIFAAPGTYTLSKELKITDGISLIGSGIEQSILLQSTQNLRAIVLDHPLALIDGFTIRGARMSKEQIHGLGVRILKLGGTVRNCLITDNQKTGGNWTHGFGIAMTGPGLVDHCIISNNNTKATLYSSVQNCYGGGLYATSGTIRNSLISDNHAWCGAGAYSAGAVSFINCTIVGNTAHRNNGSGGGVYVKGAASFINTLIYGNFVPDNSAATDSNRDLKTEDANPSSNKTTFRNCLLPPPYETILSYTENCTFGTATFIDPTALDFHPLSSSETIDNGDSSNISPNEIDLDGNPRISGNAVDIGCFEFDSNTFSCSFTASASKLFPQESLTLSSVLSGTDENDSVSYSWTISKPDGTSESFSSPSVTYTPSLCGNYSVSLSASVQGGSTSPLFEIPNCFFVAPRTIFVKVPSEESSAAALFPYDGESTAATNLHEALAIAIDGSTINLLPGNHTISSKIEIFSAITLQGSGYETTSLSPSYSGDSILVVNNKNATVSGITIKGFRTSNEILNRGAIIINDQGGLIENCRITDNVYGPKINHARGVGITLNGANARVNRCIIDRNKGSNGINNDRGGGIQAIAGIVENSLICFNTNSCAGGIIISGENVLIRNCTIVCNVGDGKDSSAYGDYGTGGIYSASKGRVENCVIAYNESPNQAGYPGYPDWRFTATQANLTAQSIFNNCLFLPSVDLPTEGIGSIRMDPLFKSIETEDFHFPAVSPLRNAGLNSSSDANALDLDGTPRRKGKFTDIGCYELPYGIGTFFILK